jgi:hypothetical protein
MRMRYLRLLSLRIRRPPWSGPSWNPVGNLYEETRISLMTSIMTVQNAITRRITLNLH